MVGPLCALGCAITWAIAIVFWRKGSTGVHAIGLNIFKNGLALGLFYPTMILVDGHAFVPTESWDLFQLLISGVIGIGISDALYLWSLNLIGASRLAIVDCLYSPAIFLLAYLFLGETLGLWQAAGGLLVLSAVFVVTNESVTGQLSRKDLIRGCSVCATAVVSMAAGILFIKPIFDKLPLFWIINVRLFAGFTSSLVIGLAMGRRAEIFGGLLRAKAKGMIILASFFGTYLSMVMWVAGFKYNKAAIAAVLNQTTTVFTVIFAALFLGETLTKRKVVATVVALAGVLLVTFG